MSLSVKINGNEVSNYILTYNREQNVCSGIGVSSFSLVNNVPFSIGVWDTVVITEDGTKVATHYILTKEVTHEGVLLLECQDESAKLENYFISDSYIIDYPSYARYWIELFLNEIGVSYVINASGQGGPISNNTTLGLGIAYEIILQLVQQSGWYFIFNKNNVMEIGQVSISPSNYKEKLDDTEIIRIDTNKNDEMLRNRAVVWGAGDPLSGSWVYADKSITTSWNYNANDKRAIVLANGSIESVTVANLLADTMLKEFARITYIKTVQCIGFYPDVSAGDTVYVKSRYYKGYCLVTSINIEFSERGWTTTFILDERCPRLFGYFNYGLDYVYIGTDGSGVWRKLIDGSEWTDFSAGLTDLNIVDLEISDGNFVCVTSGGLVFTRDMDDTAWTFVTISGLIDNDTVVSGEFSAVACTINTATNDVYALVRNDASDRGWVTRIQSYAVADSVQVAEDSNYSFTVIDVENNEKDLFVSAIGTASYPDGVNITRNFGGLSNVQPFNNANGFNTASNINSANITEIVETRRYVWHNTYRYYYTSGTVNRQGSIGTDSIVVGYSYTGGRISVISDDIVIFTGLIGTSTVVGYVVKVNFSTSSSSVIATFTPTTGFTGASITPVAIRTSSGNVTCVCVLEERNKTASNFRYFHAGVYSESGDSFSGFVFLNENAYGNTAYETLNFHPQAISPDVVVIPTFSSKSQIILGLTRRIEVTFRSIGINATTGGLIFTSDKAYTPPAGYETVTYGYAGNGFQTAAFLNQSLYLYSDGYYTDLDTGNPTLYFSEVFRITSTGAYSTYSYNEQTTGSYVRKLIVAGRNVVYAIPYTAPRVVEIIAGSGNSGTFPQNINDSIISPYADDITGDIVYYDITGNYLARWAGGTGYEVLLNSPTQAPTGGLWLCGEKIISQYSFFCVSTFSDLEGLGAGGGRVLRSTDYETFQTVQTFPVAVKLECSLTFPVIAYSGNSLYISPVGVSGTFESYQAPFIYDLRTFLNVSGYNIIPAKEAELAYYPYSVDLVTLSGVLVSGITDATKVETNNFGFNYLPYIFVAVSGGFQQQNLDGLGFTDYSTGLPSANITVIKVDDRL